MKRLMVVMTIILIIWGNALAEEVTYLEHIKPIVDSKCLHCHGPDSVEYEAFKAEKEKWLANSKGPRMDTYSHLIFYTAWPDTGALMRRLDDGKNTKDGKPGNMYIYLGSTEEERQKNLELFKKWIGNWTLKRWNDITKEELDGIKVPYMRKMK
jgi:hypothetical protein